MVGGWRDSKRVGGFRLLASYMGLVRQALVNHGDSSMVSTIDTILVGRRGYGAPLVETGKKWGWRR